jgi:cytochrome c peroxidase
MNNYTCRILKHLILLSGLMAGTAVMAGNTTEPNHSCRAPAGMVCLDGMIVPDVGLLPVIAPIPGSNLSDGDGPISHRPDLIKGEIVAVLQDEDENNAVHEQFVIYVVEDVYGQSHEVRIRQFNELDEYGEPMFRVGTRVLVDKRGATAENPNLGTLKLWPLGEKEELGRKMFCDNRLAKDNIYGCATCHLPHHGFADFHETSLGTDGKHGTRNTPTLYNAAFTRPLFWDGRARTLEDQAFHPLMNPIEMNITARELRKKLAASRELVFLRLPMKWAGSENKPPAVTRKVLESITVETIGPIMWEKLSLPHNTLGVVIIDMISAEDRTPAETAGLRKGDVIQQIKSRLIETQADYNKVLNDLTDDEEVGVRLLRQGRYYSEDFKDVFGADINFQAIAEALSAYERTILLTNSVFDRYMSGLKPSEFGEAEKSGLKLFRGKARCILCHNGPNFTDGKFHNVGYPVDEQGHYALHDMGRYVVTRTERDKGAFKTPSLRGLPDTWPYMHDGLIPSNFKSLPNNTQRLEKGLEEAVEFFNRGGGKGNPYADPLMKPLSLSKNEKKNLIAFLKTLARPRRILLPDCPFNVDLAEDPNESIQRQMAR